MLENQQIIERDGDLELRATISHGHGGHGEIAFYRKGQYMFTIHRDSPRARKWSWDVPKKEQARWIELAARVSARAREAVEAARLADKPI